ncbi:MAG: type II toxin-antitoxin system HicB family antitoxin [Desulfovibrionaceae bacterium]|nr:type II toxin-antitoxin system HicB family antitoxin [Desulfovibrionaceae bacterium]
MLRYYFCAFIPSEDGGYAIMSPDFPEALSQGDDLEDAMFMATDCLRVTVEAYDDQGDAIPEPCALAAARERIAANLKGNDWKPEGEILYPLVPVVLPDATLTRACLRLTWAEVQEIDRRAEKHGMKRSEFLLRAARAYHPDRS